MLTWCAARRAIGYLIFILCPALHAQTFAQSVNYPVGSNPFGIAAADFNRDGKPDLVVVNQADNTISVLLNAGNGTFGAATTYPTGPSPQFVAVGDFNNDGNPDVIVANTNASTIGIFLGNGDGTLRPMVSIGVGFEPIALAVADFNSDGRLDIAVANFGSNTVSVLLGNGDGSFQAPTDYAVDINPRSIVAGDFNGDGKSDIAVSHGVFTISVLLNAGNGTFAPAVNSKFAFGGGSIAAADLNGDGRLDLVLANQGIGGFSVLLGAGDGTFSLLAQFSTFALLFPNSIALADMNGDGHIDLIVADTITGINVFGGDGKGSFSAPARFFADVRPWYAITADFNRDGQPDVAVVNTSSNDVSVLVNTTVPAAGSTTGWRMQGINPSRTNAATVKGPETLPGFKILAPNVNGALERIALDGSLILMQPLATNFSPSIGVVSSYSRAGKLQWTTNVPTDLFGLRDVAVSQFGTVYVTPSATLSNLIALDANSGQQLWTQSNNTSNRSHPLAVGSDGTIYFTSGSGPLQGKISAINPDGSLKWQIIGPESNIALSTDESSLYVLTTKGIAVPTGDVRRYSTADGSFIANTPCDPRGDVYAFAPWNVLYTGNGNNDLLAFPPDIQNCPVISANGMVAVGIASTTTTGRIITANNDGTLGGLDQLGNLLWKSAEPLSQAFSSSDGVIYAVAPVTNDLVALDSEHGTVLWRRHFADPITGQFLGDDGNIYLTAGTNLFVSTIAPALGTISVSTNNAGATFKITGPASYSGNGTSFIQTNAPVGTYTVSYGTIPGFTVSPLADKKTLIAGASASFAATYTALPPVLGLTSIQLIFGDQPVGFSSSAMTVTLTNIGGQLLTLSLSVSGDFQQSNNCEISLSPGASCTASISFTPTATGILTGTLTIVDNSQGSPHSVALSGAGIPAVGRPILFVNGFCGTPEGWSAMELDLFLRLHRQYPTLYTNAGVYEASTDGSSVDWTFLEKKLQQKEVAQTARFFTIRFSDPRTNNPNKKFDITNVADVPIAVKGNELAQVLQSIREISGQQDVIVIAHSMGGLVGRAYMENLASPPTTCSKDGLIQFVPGTTGYASDIAQLITLDTPHAGSGADAWLRLPFSCFKDNTVNRQEMLPSADGGQFIGALNYLPGFTYNGATAAPLAPQTRYIAIKSYTILLSFLTLLFSDDVLSDAEQDMAASLGNPDSPKIQTVENFFADVPPDLTCRLVTTLDKVPVLHLLGCVGAQKQTLDRVWNVTHASVLGRLAGSFNSQPGGTCKK